MPTPPKTRTDLKTALASFLLAAIVLIPAAVGYIEAKTDSIKSKMAIETAKSEMTYEQLAERANKTENDRRLLMLEVARLREVAIEQHPNAEALTSSTSPTVAKAEAEIRSPTPPLPTTRPAPPAAAVQAAERAIEAQ